MTFKQPFFEKLVAALIRHPDLAVWASDALASMRLPSDIAPIGAAILAKPARPDFGANCAAAAEMLDRVPACDASEAMPTVQCLLLLLGEGEPEFFSDGEAEAAALVLEVLS